MNDTIASAVKGSAEQAVSAASDKHAEQSLTVQAGLPSAELLEKYEKLKECLRAYGSVAVAFSSGVDSTFLLRAAKDALGDKVIALTAAARSVPKRELSEADDYCRSEGIRHFVCEADELSIEGYAENPKNRCYLCKHELFSRMLKKAREQGMAELVEGSNLDDNGDYRPGMQAIAELKVKSPLRECGFYKSEIRELSRYLGLPTWDKQSYACLATRFVYGETITEEKLNMVDKAEQLLIDLGFHQLRVRIHDRLARIEIDPSEFQKIMQDEVRAEICRKFREYGFSYVSLDLLGYRTGSMNETIDTKLK